jgi:hypothetical protein
MHSYFRISSLLFLPVGDGGTDGVLGQHGAVDFDGRQAEFLHDLGVLDRQGFVDGLTLNPLGR